MIRERQARLNLQKCEHSNLQFRQHTEQHSKNLCRSTAATYSRVIVATGSLDLISFWRAAAIVLNDLASSRTMPRRSRRLIGKPRLVHLASCVFLRRARGLRESCSMFVARRISCREDVSRDAREFSVSALMFDYILTGRHGRRAGHYSQG